MYKMITQNGETVYGVSEFVADTKEDLEKLPRSCNGQLLHCFAR